MATTVTPFSQWLAEACISEDRLSPEQRGLLQGAFHFRQQQGTDSFSTRLLSHFLLNAGSGLKVAQVARLLHVSRPTASRQQKCSSKEAVQQAHHRLTGRPYGKLLPRYAGPLAAFLFAQPTASRGDLLAFIASTFGIRVSTVALSKFLKKYGLDRATRQAAQAQAVPALPPPEARPAADPAPPPPLPQLLLAQGQPVPEPAPPFSPPAPSTPGLFCCCPRPSTG